MASTTNNINTQLGNSLSGVINNVFTDHPFLNQYFDENVRKCALENILSDCTNPPSISQLNTDIQKADSILEFLSLNDYYNKDTVVFMYDCIIKFLKVKKCTQAQYPCFADDIYQVCLIYINNFDFIAS